MSKIKSTIPVVIEAMYQESGTILIEINSPEYDLMAGTIRCNINYYQMEEMRSLRTQTWSIPISKANELIVNIINGGGNDALQDALAVILLEKVQTELLADGVHTIYNLLPNQWQLSNEILEKRSQNQLPIKEILKA